MKAKNIPSKSSESFKPAQPSSNLASVSRKAIKPSKITSNSVLEQVYRLPPSLKRTEAFIKNSIQQQRLSSEIVTLVGSTFRLKNQTDGCNSSSSAFESYPPLSKGSNLSDTLETLYEEDTESSRDSIEILYTDHSTPDDFTRRTIYKALDTSLCLPNYGVHSYSSHDLHREIRSNAVDEKMYSTVVYNRKDAQTERLSCSPTRKRDNIPVTCDRSLNKKVGNRGSSSELLKGKENIRQQRNSINSLKQKIPHQSEKVILQETQKNLRSLENKIERLKQSSNIGKELYKKSPGSQLNPKGVRSNQVDNRKANSLIKNTKVSEPMKKIDENRNRAIEGWESNRSISKIRSESSGRKETAQSKSVERTREESEVKRGNKRIDILASIQKFDRKVQAKNI